MTSFTIVSFCGGGIRGLLSARILERLSRIQPNILRTTTLFAGTSTGAGIVSLLLAQLTPDEIGRYFLHEERDFFSKPVSTSPNAPRYNVAEVAAGQFVLHGDKKLGDFEQGVLFTAFFVGAEVVIGQHARQHIPWGPRLYTNLQASGTSDVSIVDAVTQSSAMPGMMGSWRHCVDGAFVNHDPTIAAIALAVENGATLDDIAVINIGTGLMPDWIADDTGTWGAAQWMSGGPNGNAGNQTPPFLLNWSTPTPVLDMALSGTSANLTPLLAGKLLGSSRYVSINPQLDWYIPEDATSDADMAELEVKAMTVDLEPATVVLQNWADEA